ncbi:MAG: undecaprenyl-diphosphate phosphatase [Clostridiaceae bacterium]|jgi:undecaprenyl-diphosphatase|nr:undecaprenyl-diphosphate phosphatase [Clostridiaceae bacterium]
MEWIEVFKAVLFGIIEGITEWLPVSSTGHMILLDELVTIDLSSQFKSMFLVVVQLGAIMAVVMLFWKNIWPFPRKYNSVTGKKGFGVNRSIINLWLKILVACVPAGIVGILFDEQIDELFYNYLTVAIMLIVVGIAFIIIENYNKNRRPQILESEQITYKIAIIIGVFQLVSAVLPGTSRSGATILGGILIGLSRQLAAEFTFYLAIPVMFGASVLKLVKMDYSLMGALEWTTLITGMLVAFAVSYLVINFLMNYIRKNDFKVFGYYRIALGALVLLYFAVLA